MVHSGLRFPMLPSEYFMLPLVPGVMVEKFESEKDILLLVLLW